MNITNARFDISRSQRTVLQAVRLHGPISRTELAPLTGLTAQAISTISGKLIDRRLVSAVGRRRGRRGQPAVELAVDRNGTQAIGASVDRDFITTVLVDFEGSIRARIEHSVSFPTPKEAFQIIEQSVADLLRQEDRNRDDTAGVGVSIPGRRDPGTGRLIAPRNFKSWENVSVDVELAKQVYLPVWFENDGTAMAFGESYYGIGRAYPTFMHIYVGMGLSCGLVVDRLPYRGLTGNAGEIGLIPVPHDLGHLSKEVSPNRAVGVASIAALHESLRVKGITIQDLSELETHLLRREPWLMEWLEAAADALMPPIVAAKCILDPGAILIGGRLPAPLLDYLLDLIQTKAPDWLEPEGAKLRLLHAISGIDTAALGAAALVMHEVFSPHIALSGDRERSRPDGANGAVMATGPTPWKSSTEAKNGAGPDQPTLRSSSVKAADARAIGLLSGSSRWVLKEQTTFQFNTYHPQGLTRCGEHFFLSSVEIIEPARHGDAPGIGRGHLFRTDIHGALTGHVDLGEGDIYHPGGIDFDGTWVWVPVAEYRPYSRSIIYRVDPESLEKFEVFRTDDHISAIVARPTSAALHGFSWASRHIYSWPLDADLKVTVPGKPPILLGRFAMSPTIAHQDCQYLGDGLAICSGTFDGYGAIDVIDLENNKVINHVLVDFIRSADGFPLTRNPHYAERHGNKLRFYFAPDDNKTILYVCEVGPGE